MRNPRRWVRNGGVAALVGAVIWWLWRPTAVAVDTAPVQRGTLTVTIEEEGETRVRERFVVAAPVAGRIDRLAVQAGDTVRIGAPIARITPVALDSRTRAELSARLEAALDAARTAETEVTRSAAALEQASRERARIDRLFQQNVIAAETRERAILAETAALQQHVGADHRARAAGHEVDEARAALSSGTGAAGVGILVRSPAAGRILAVVERSERVLPAGAPVVEIGDLSDLEVVVALLSTDVVRVRIGDTMTLTGWGREDTLLARVTRIEPSGFTKVSALGVEEQRVRVIGAVQSPPPSLGDRFRVEAAIAIARRGPVILAPRGALFRSASRWKVFVVRDGRARERTVQVGLQGRDQAEITTGLEPGDLTILHPDERIANGVRVIERPGSP